MTDTHIHLSYKYFEQHFPYIDMEQEKYTIVPDGDREGLIAKMKERGITCCIEPAIDVASNELLLNLSKKHEGFIFPAVGNHPTRSINSSLGDFKKVKEFAEDPSIIAIGEAGLDYHYDRKDQHRLKQKIWFQFQINLADKLGLPLILHIRSADEDGIKMLRKNKKKLHGGVCHCFGSGPETARVYTRELGLCLGIGGTLLMKPEISTPLKQTVIDTPMEFLMLETDGPYVKPEKPDEITAKKWGKARNTSLILSAVVRRISELKDIPVYDVIRITDENARRVFGI